MSLIALPQVISIGDGIDYYPGVFDRDAQTALLRDVAAIIAAAPYFTPRMPRSAKPFSVEMTNAGSLGWVSDVDGYRYQPNHPVTGEPWPPIPGVLLGLWSTLGAPLVPEACLVNHYQGKAKLGLHQDRDEETFDAPVVSVSLGDSAVFRVGGEHRRDPTRSLKLHSGDVITLGGPGRLAFHGIDRVITGSSTLWDGGGRINLTLRRVTRA